MYKKVDIIKFPLLPTIADKSLLPWPYRKEQGASPALQQVMCHW